MTEEDERQEILHAVEWASSEEAPENEWREANFTHIEEAVEYYDRLIDRGYSVKQSEYGRYVTPRAKKISATWVVWRWNDSDYHPLNEQNDNGRGAGYKYDSSTTYVDYEPLDQSKLMIRA